MSYPELKENEVLANYLDTKKLGNLLLTIVLSSNHLGHKNLKGVFAYIRKEKGENLEIEYIKDVFTMKTPDIVNKWFGGDKNASIILQKSINWEKLGL